MSYITIAANEPYHSIKGGIPRFLQELMPKLTQSYKVKLLVVGSSQKLQIENPNPNLEIYHFPHYSLPVGASYPPKFISKTVKKIISESNLVFIQTVECLIPLFYAWRCQKPLVMYFHGIDWETFPRALRSPWLGKKIIPLVRAYSRFWHNKCSRILIPSIAMEETIRKAGIKPPLEVIPLGINHQTFSPPMDKGSAKEKAGFSPDDIIIGYTGRLAREKNIGYLLDVFNNLQTNFGNLKLLLVGSGVKDFQATIENNPRIRYVKQTNEITPYLQAMDIFCMPSETETSSLSTMEAMACGIPAVAHNVGAIKDYLHHERNGFLCNLGDHTTFRNHLEMLIKNPSLREEMGKKARDCIESSFDWDITVQKMVSTFHEILAQRETYIADLHTDNLPLS